ncbi:MAG: pyridoxamine 5'-phosphate oxidase family protein [Catenulisporales bacterium]|nr:pyridoxamine 5'-phosphate oxidase family protein [Catenulisporales bacterium]
MATVHEVIDDNLRAFIEAQPLFFVATAPLAADGHVNVSPKGTIGSLAVLGPDRLAYLDLTGSGAESLAHLRENGRITLMWAAFDGPPNIVRVHGVGEVVFRDDPRWPEYVGLFPAASDPGPRAIVLVSATRVSDSCGFAVPYMEYKGERRLLAEYFGRRDEEFHVDYVARKNAVSIDGLPAVPVETLRGDSG